MRVPRKYVAALVVVAVLGLVAWQGHRFYVNHKLEQTLHAWDGAGGQTLVTALAEHRVYAAENAAVTYHQAFDVVRQITEADLPVLHDPYGATDEQLESLMLRADGSLQLLSGVTDAALCAWPIRYDEGMAAKRPHLTPAKIITDLLIASAVLHMRQDQPQAAAESLAAGLTLAQYVATDPLLISNATTRGMDRAVLMAMERLFSDDAQVDLTTLRQHLDGRSYRAGVLRGLMAEGAVWLNHVRMPAYEHDARYSLVPADMRSDTTAYLQTLLALVARLEQPAYAPPLPGVIPDPPQWASLLLQVRDRLHELSYLIAEDEARLIQARVALKLREYKAVHGSYPAHLAECGIVPRDPINGQVMAYKRVGDGFELRAAGYAAQRPAVAWRWEQ